MEHEESIGYENSGFKADQDKKYSPDDQISDCFDMKQRLAQINELRGQKEGLTEAQSKQLVRHELKNLKYDLETQTKNIASEIKKVQQIIEDDPGISSEELFGPLRANVSELKFSREILNNFQAVFIKYEENHKLIEMYCELYSPEELFEKCFGTKLQGSVDFEKRPMCIVFRCFNENDYAMAYKYAEVLGDLTSLDSRDKEEALSSGGAVLGSVGMPELNKLIVIENCSKTGYQFRDGDMMGIDIPESGSGEVLLISDDYAFRSQGEEFKVKMLGYDKEADLSRMQFTKSSANGEYILSDIAIIPHRDSLDVVTHCTFRSYNKKSREKSSLRSEFISSRGEILGTVFVDSVLNLTFTDAGKGSQILSTQEVANIDRDSKKVLTHEEQHVYDNLFVPVERTNDLETVLSQSVETGHYDTAKTWFVDHLVRSERKNIGIDSMARDEIIAYCKDGRGLNEIKNILMDNELYNYKDNWYYQDRIREILERVRTGLLELRQLFNLSENEVNAPSEESEIQTKIDQVFGEVYEKDVLKWLGAVRSLEEKGYKRDEIVPVLYSAPIGEWEVIARRKPMKQLQSFQNAI